jgi:AcrR family transcriptional regulator
MPSSRTAHRQDLANEAHPDRRARRRQETIDEILQLAIDIMAEEGVAGLTIAEVARRLGVRPASIYKYFPSRLSIYDELFQRGAIDARDAIRAAADAAKPGMNAVLAVSETVGRWVVANHVLAQLLLWRPVPMFRPSAEAFAASEEVFDLMRRVLAGAVHTGELGPEAATAQGADLLACLVAGALTNYMANEPEEPWNQGRFTPLLPRIVDLIRYAFPPSITAGSARR